MPKDMKMISSGLQQSCTQERNDSINIQMIVFRDYAQIPPSMTIHDTWRSSNIRGQRKPRNGRPGTVKRTEYSMLIARICKSYRRPTFLRLRKDSVVPGTEVSKNAGIVNEDLCM